MNLRAFLRIGAIYFAVLLLMLAPGMQASTKKSAIPVDTIVLKNGEVLKGSWEQVQGANLVFQAKKVGVITVPASEIVSFSTSVPAIAILANGSTVRGQLKLTPKEQWRLYPANARPLASFAIVFPATAFAKYRKTLTSTPWLNWMGMASAGYSLQTGNTQAGTLTAMMNATRLQPNIPGLNTHWRTTFSLASVLAHTKNTLTGATISSNTFNAILRQDRLFGSKAQNFVFAMDQFQYIQPEGIRGLETVGGGFGRQLVKTPQTSFNLLGGMTFTHTNYLTAGTPPSKSAEALVGWTLSWKIAKSIILSHYVNFYPNLSQTGQYRFDTLTTLAVPIFKRISFQISYLDIYISNPPPGNRKNNATFSMGIGYTF